MLVKGFVQALIIPGKIRANLEDMAGTGKTE